jgi:hypothetical protein
MCPRCRFGRFWAPPPPKPTSSRRAPERRAREVRACAQFWVVFGGSVREVCACAQFCRDTCSRTLPNLPRGTPLPPGGSVHEVCAYAQFCCFCRAKCAPMHSSVVFVGVRCAKCAPAHSSVATRAPAPSRTSRGAPPSPPGGSVHEVCAYAQFCCFCRAKCAPMHSSVVFVGVRCAKCAPAHSSVVARAPAPSRTSRGGFGARSVRLRTVLSRLSREVCAYAQFCRFCRGSVREVCACAQFCRRTCSRRPPEPPAGHPEPRGVRCAKCAPTHSSVVLSFLGGVTPPAPYRTSGGHRIPKEFPRRLHTPNADFANDP